MVSAFSGRRVLVTGHTGFKGSWLSLWLSSVGAAVSGYALPAERVSHFRLAGIRKMLASHVEADIRDKDKVLAVIRKVRPDVVFHLAAQAIVREGYARPDETFEVNTLGTVNVLESIRKIGAPCVIVAVTSDKCYANVGQIWGYRECDAMGGNDPYSASKGAAELVVKAYRESYFPPSMASRHGVRLASARAGNVIGGGDWAKDRIVPDCIRALRAQRPILVRNPSAVRPWQHVLEPLHGYMSLAAAMAGRRGASFCDAWNFGPDVQGVQTVRALANGLVSAWGSGRWTSNVSPSEPAEAGFLGLNCDKAFQHLGWRSRWCFRRTIEETVRWYKEWSAGNRDMGHVSCDQVLEYSRSAAQGVV